MALILTLNTYLLDIRLFGRVPVYRAAPHIEPRRRALARALAGTGADVICLQEVFRKPHRRDLAESLRSVYPHAAGLRHPGLPLGSGLMVLSRHPIRAARPREFRAAVFEERLAVRMGMLDCLIDLPDLGPTRVVDFHLSAGGLRYHPEAPEAEALRARQASELAAASRAPGAPVAVLAGDLNAGPHTSRDTWERVLAAGHRDAFAEGTGQAHKAAVTWDPDNPMITGELNRSLPPQRIDHVFLREEGGDGLVAAEARVVLDEAPVDVGGPLPVPLSDHYGVMVRIERG